MMRPEHDSAAARERSSRAAAWLVRRDRGLTPEEQDEFSQWLAADPRHGEWFALHRHTVGDFGLLLQWRPEHSDQPNPDLLAPLHRFPRWLVPVALAAASIALVFGWLFLDPAAPEMEAPIADYERRILEDGSTVELNRGAVVTVVYSSGERRVTLERGEALFTVTKKPDRPFIVRAGGVDVRAIGTAFNVRLEFSEVEVLVTEGRVALATREIAGRTLPDPADGGPATSDANNRPNAIGAGLAFNAGRVPSSAAATPISELVAGQRAIVSRMTIAPPVIETVTAEESARLLSWQPQLLDFSSVPLERAILEFNRRNRVQFAIADAELAALPIVASIRSDNVEGFAQFLAATPDIRVERRGDAMIVLRRNR